LNKEQLKLLLHEEDEIEKLRLENIKDYDILVDFLVDNDVIIRRNALKLLFSTSYVPTEKILKTYIKIPDPLIREVIIEKLHHFIPLLADYLIKEESFDVLCEIVASLKPGDIFDSIKSSYSVTPVSSTLAELSVRTCYSSFSNYEETFIDFNFISEHPKSIKKILAFRMSQSNSTFPELTLLTLTKYPELTHLIVKELRDLISKTDKQEHVKYAALALMHVDDPKNSNILIDRLSNFDDNIDTQLSIIEALGNLGNPKATSILVKQFKKGDPAGYYAAKSLALIGESVLPQLIIALEEDRNIPFIIESMKRIGDESYDYLMDALHKGKKDVRKNAAQCLTLVMSQKYGYEGAIRLLTTQLAGKNPSIIEAVTQALLTLGTPSIRVLIEELTEDDLQLRKNAIEVLHYFGNENIELALDGLLDVNLAQVVKLGTILYIYYPEKELQDLGYSFAIHKGKFRVKDDEVFQLLEKSLKEIDPIIREKACELLNQFGAKSVPILSSILSDPNINLRRKAVESLRKVKHKRALMTLIKAARDNDDSIAEISTRALGELKDPGVIDVIIDNMRRPKVMVREAAVYAAVQIGAPIVKKLSEKLSTPNQNLVKSTIKALGQMDSKILDLILPKLKTADERWFNNLQQVIQNMGKNAANPLKKYYGKIKTPKTKDRIIILLSLARETSIVPEAVKKVVEEEHKLGIKVLNNLGALSIEPIIKEMKKLNAEGRKIFANKSRGLKADIIIELIKSASKDKKISSLSKQLLKIHTRVLRRYFHNKQMKFDEFLEKYS
jgi:HEAT repeat protein